MNTTIIFLDRVNIEPAAYPPNDAEESDAITTLEALLDSKKVKTDIRARDKVPNNDGSIELVDANQRPIGYVQVQVRKIPTGTTRYDCPVELVAYSSRITSPFLLFGVDVENRKAYWAHISSMMPEFKADQKTFTIRFQPHIDEVGSEYPYYARWLEICRDYQRRISEYPTLAQSVDDQISLRNLGRDDTIFFQRFIEEINTLLDIDVPIVKYEKFADAWKLGMTIHRSDAKAVSFSIFTIPFGQSAPLLRHIPRVSDQPVISVGGKAVSGVIALSLDSPSSTDIWQTRDSFGDPTAAARRFVFSRLSKLIRDRSLHVFGTNQSAELLSWFLSEYAHTLGMKPACSYQVNEVAYGLKVFLPTWLTVNYPRTIDYFRREYAPMMAVNPNPSFEQIANRSLQAVQANAEEIAKAVKSPRQASMIRMRTRDVEFKALFQAVDYLHAAGVASIAPITRPYTKMKARPWDCLTPEDLEFNMVTILKAAVSDYKAFIEGNRFGRLDSPIISNAVSLIYVSDPAACQGTGRPPGLIEYRVRNTDRSLPAFTFINSGAEKYSGLVTRSESGDLITLDGRTYKVLQETHSIWNTFSNRLPIRDVLYELLLEDLKTKYGNNVDL